MGGSDKTEKTTKMVLKVDLQCPSCYKKVKKVVCKIPQIRDQEYDEKANTVTITVLCCSPEKIRDKLCYKGGKAIKSIEMKEPSKPKAPEKPKETEKSKQPDKPKETEKSKQPDKPKETNKPKVVTFETPKESEKPKQKEAEKPKEATKAAMVAQPPVPELGMMMMPVPGYPQPAVGCACGQCYYTGGPCYQWYGGPVAPAPYYNNYSYGYGPGPNGYGRGYHVNSDYFSEENASGCTIM